MAVVAAQADPVPERVSQDRDPQGTKRRRHKTLRINWRASSGRESTYSVGNHVWGIFLSSCLLQG